MREVGEMRSLRIAEIKERAEEGFYLSRKIYEIIAEKVLKEFFRKK